MATVVAELSKELMGLGHEVTVAARIDGSALHEADDFASLGRVPWPDSAYAKLRWKAESGLNRAFGWPWPAYASYLGALVVATAPLPGDTRRHSGAQRCVRRSVSQAMGTTRHRGLVAP